MTSPSEADGEAIERELADAIAGVLARHERSITTHWVALVETINPDGRRGLWTFTDPDLMAWDTVGMLTHGLHLQQAQTLAHVLGDDE